MEKNTKYYCKKNNKKNKFQSKNNIYGNILLTVCVRACISKVNIFKFNFLLWVFQTFFFLGIWWLLFTIIWLTFFPRSTSWYFHIKLNVQFQFPKLNWSWWFGGRSLIGMAKIKKRRKQNIKCFFVVLEWTEFRRHRKDALPKGWKREEKKDEFVQSNILSSI